MSGPASDDHAAPPATERQDALVDWARTGRRMRRVVLTLGVLVLALWTVDGFTGGTGFRWRILGELTGLALLVTIAAEIAIVGGAAVVGMFRAGERGDRLAGSDVSLLPPQLRRGRRG